MSKRICLVIAAFAALTSFAIWRPAEDWPVMRTYDGAHLYRIALPLGGIGTGSVSLGGRGDLVEWQLMNIPAKQYSTIKAGNDAPFFAIRTETAQGDSQTSALIGPFYDHEFEAAEGHPAMHHGIPHFARAEFDAAYPFGQVRLSDPQLPVRVRIRAFNPFVPCDAEASGIPVAVLCYEVENLTDAPLKASVCGSLRNFIGRDGWEMENDWFGEPIVPKGAKKNRNDYRVSEKGFRGIYFRTEGVETNRTSWGTMALVTEEENCTYRTFSSPNGWFNSILNFWDDFSSDGLLTDQPPTEEDDPMGALSAAKVIAPRARESFTFFLTWSFPNRKAWSTAMERNWYAKDYPDAWVAAEKTIPRIGELERRTLAFVRAFDSATIPAVFREAALFNTAVLRSPTVFRLADGRLFGWEGVMDHVGSCHGSCTHVWNYEQVTPYLFGDLARTMRDVELNYMLNENGSMTFRVNLPLEKGKSKFWTAAADGQMGCVVKAYREWQMSGDDAFLKSNWPQIKRTLEWAWKSEANWDADCDGVMEGNQHNTMDIWYSGPNPEVGFWYLAALRAASRMAAAVGEADFSSKCDRLAAQGAKWMDGHLFNGEYYEQIVLDVKTKKPIALDDPAANVPDYQCGRCCLADQFVGQYVADLCGLGTLADPENEKTALRSIMRYNYKTDFLRHFNNMRTYALADEGGLLVASWPRGRLKTPFPYYSEVWTGIEYGAAIAMIYAGMTDEAQKIVETTRSRHEGARRNPFSEPECGHHYVRSMASWGLIPALAGFRYSAVDGTMEFTDRPGRYFWSNGYAYGLCEIRKPGEGTRGEVVLSVIEGDVNLKRFTLRGRARPLGTTVSLTAGHSQTFEL